MLLKLICVACVHSVVPRIMGARGDLIEEHGAVGQEEKLDAKDSAS